MVVVVFGQTCCPKKAASKKPVPQNVPQILSAQVSASRGECFECQDGVVGAGDLKHDCLDLTIENCFSLAISFEFKWSSRTFPAQRYLIAKDRSPLYGNQRLALLPNLFGPAKVQCMPRPVKSDVRHLHKRNAKLRIIEECQI